MSRLDVPLKLVSESSVNVNLSPSRISTASLIASPYCGQVERSTSIFPHFCLPSPASRTRPLTHCLLVARPGTSSCASRFSAGEHHVLHVSHHGGVPHPLSGDLSASVPHPASYPPRSDVTDWCLAEYRLPRRLGLSTLLVSALDRLINHQLAILDVRQTNGCCAYDGLTDQSVGVDFLRQLGPFA